VALYNAEGKKQTDFYYVPSAGMLGIIMVDFPDRPVYLTNREHIKE